MPARLPSSSLKGLCPGSGPQSRSGDEKRTPCLSLDFVKAGLKCYPASLRMLPEGIKSGCSFPFWRSHGSVKSTGIRLPGPRLRGFLSLASAQKSPACHERSGEGSALLPAASRLRRRREGGRGRGRCARPAAGTAGWAPTAGRQPGGKKG